MADKPLSVYLNDHLAGAKFGSDLAGQLAQRADGTPLGARMRTLADEVEADRKTLQQVMQRVGVARNPVKEATTWIGEKLSRAKLSGLSAGERELGLFLALETLALGVEGKAALWTTLGEVAERYPGLTGTDFDALRERAAGQRQVLEQERLAAAERAFTGPGGG